MTATSAGERPRLRLARAITDGRVELPDLSAPRAVCLLARQELEAIVDELLEAKAIGCPRASMRARLVCLGQAYVDEPGLVFTTSTLWWRLSSACHHHAYELGPTAREAAGLLEGVSGIGAAAGSARRS